MDYFEEEYYRQMSKKLGCLPILLLCVVLSFVGCKTIKESEIIEVHDTITTYKVDTLREYKQKTLHDTVNIYTEKILTLNEDGEVVKEVNNHYYHEKVVEKDSTDIYKSLLDSIKQSLNTNHEKEKVIEKKDWWAEWKWKLIAFALFVAVILLAIKFIFPKWKKYNNKSNI